MCTSVVAVSIEYLPKQGQENPHRHHRLTSTNITANHSGSIFSARSWCSCQSLVFVAEQQQDGLWWRRSCWAEDLGRVSCSCYVAGRPIPAPISTRWVGLCFTHLGVSVVSYQSTIRYNVCDDDDISAHPGTHLNQVCESVHQV